MKLSACLHLVRVSLRRQLRSRQAMISVLFLLFVALVVIAWNTRGERSPQAFIEQIVRPVYVSFLLPMFCLCFASASISGEREEGALVYLLMTPLPRPLIHLAKFLTALGLSLCWSMAGLAILCLLAGRSGWQTFEFLWAPAMIASLAYVGLFHLLSVVFRRATIVALAYALFLEAFLGNMPGTVKRVAINFYTQCLIFDASAVFGVGSSGPHQPAHFLPVSPTFAYGLLAGLAIGLFILGTWLFSRREYR